MEKETKIHRLRNLMTPIVNYFALLGRLNSDDTEIEEFNKLIKLLHKENDNVDSVIGEIRKIIADIPDCACEGNDLKRDNDKCTLPVVINNEAMKCKKCNKDKVLNAMTPDEGLCTCSEVALPTLDELFEKAKHHMYVKCNLQNFEDEDSILLYQGKYVDGYIRAIRDFVNGDYDPDKYVDNDL